MSPAALAAIAVTAVLIAALAFYLLWVLVLLGRLTDTLGKVVFGVRAIASRVEPVAGVVTAINADLTAVAGALEALGRDLGADERQPVESATTG